MLCLLRRKVRKLLFLEFTDFFKGHMFFPMPNSHFQSQRSSSSLQISWWGEKSDANTALNHWARKATLHTFCSFTKQPKPGFPARFDFSGGTQDSAHCLRFLKFIIQPPQYLSPLLKPSLPSEEPDQPGLVKPTKSPLSGLHVQSSAAHQEARS